MSLFPFNSPHCVYVDNYENKVFYFQIVDLCIRMYLHYIYLQYLFLNISFNYPTFLLIQSVTFR